MSIWETLALAVVQGLTEFLPVSSSGHLVLANSLFGIQGPDSFTLILLLHLATASAAAGFYHREVRSLFSALLPPYGKDVPEKREGRRTVIVVVVATLATAVVALVFRNSLEGLFEEPRRVAINLFVTGAVLFAASFRREGGTALVEAPWWKALVVGLAQGAALAPGISRSGVTIAAALFLGLRRAEAVKLSFLLLLPATFGAAVLEWGKVASLGGADLLQSIGGFFAAAFVGYASIYLVLRWTREGHLWYFGLYCWSVAVAVFLAGPVFFT